MTRCLPSPPNAAVAQELKKILFLLTKMVETCSVAFLIQMISYGGPKLLAHRQVIVLLSEWQQLDLPSRIEGLSMKGPN